MKAKFSIIIGRFQPLHHGHVSLIEHASQVGENVIIVIGSHNIAPNLRNPFSSEERIELIKANVSNELFNKIHFIFQEDKLCSDEVWVENLRSQVSEITKNEKDIIIVGHDKDQKLYNRLVPEWIFEPVPGMDTWTINATTIRKMFLDPEINPELIYGIPKATAQFLKQYKLKKPKKYKELVTEHRYVTNYKQQWENTPYPVIFNTVDAIVLHRNNILLIIRDGEYGKGLKALPGGFIDANKDYSILDAVIRELQEETKLKIPVEVLKDRLVATHVFDSPNRSQRGRVFSHTHLFDLRNIEEDIYIEADDDALDVEWHSLDIKRDIKPKFFSDHWEIMEFMLSKYLDIRFGG